MIEIATQGDMREWSRAVRARGRRLALVPTMGFLHDGHLRLVDAALDAADDVVMSIFVNPLQFGPSEDLDRYPRDLARDRSLAAGRGVACLFAPSVEEMYGVPALVRVAPGPLADHLCGPRRPGHFAGVLTVVAKLFNAVEPDVAVFGRKDVQQARLIARMVTDLSFPIAILVAPIVREADGLAMSSRNAYLSETERASAAAIPAALDAAHAAYRRGERQPAVLTDGVRRALVRAGLQVEYVEAVDPDTLAPVGEVADATVLALAARAGNTRLIDNIPLGAGLAADAHP